MWRPDWQWDTEREGYLGGIQGYLRRCMIDNAPPGALQLTATCSGWMIEKLSHINYNCNKERAIERERKKERDILEICSAEIQDPEIQKDTRYISVRSLNVSNGFSISRKLWWHWTHWPSRVCSTSRYPVMCKKKRRLTSFPFTCLEEYKRQDFSSSCTTSTYPVKCKSRTKEYAAVMNTIFIGI